MRGSFTNRTFKGGTKEKDQVFNMLHYCNGICTPARIEDTNTWIFSLVELLFCLRIKTFGFAGYSIRITMLFFVQVQKKKNI